MTVTYTLNVRHRPNVNEDIVERHNRYLKKQIGIGSPWELSTGPENQFKEKDVGPGNISSNLMMGRRMGKGVSGSVSYSCRVESYLDDYAKKDDSIILNFKLRNINYEKLVLTDFPNFVKAFEAYTAEIHIHDYTMHESEAWREFSKTTGDLRKAIFRIPPVSFYDRMLCQRAFNLTPEEIVQRLQSKVEQVYCCYDGVVIIYSSKPVSEEVYLSVNENIKSSLAKKRRKFFGII